MRTFLLIIFNFTYSGVFAQSQSIHLNSPGFLLQSSKKTSVIGTAETFEIKQVAGQKDVFNGEISSPAFQKDGNQNVADISSRTKNGKYYLKLVGGTKSVGFTLSAM